MMVDLSTYKKNSAFYAPKAFLITVKSFDLQKIRARYLQSRQSKHSRVGSVERREAAQGGLVYVEIENGVISKYEILSFLTEPRGIDVAKDMIAVSTENVVHVIRNEGIERIDNPWFSYIHTVQFNHRHGADRILVSSSGYDCIFEYDLTTFQKTWEWFAWEHGFQKGYNAKTGKDILLTRDVKEAAKFRETGKDYLFISDPERQTLPTAQRAAFINSVLYDCNEKAKLLATFFHDGAVYRIDMNDGTCERILGGMKSPHGGRNYRNHYMATSTAAGELVFSAGNKISFAGLPGKPEELTDLEWLQNSAPFSDCIITIDANRNSFVLIDPDHSRYDMIPFDPNWAIQDIAEVSDPAAAKLVKEMKDKL
ncbi:MAG: hypothetical protein DRJ15_09795 [Bacteroidetes bacterium]|nr:MAG: hypothetical protein DRJ15_09795 [Bacteroidota bacterium]